MIPALSNHNNAPSSWAPRRPLNSVRAPRASPADTRGFARWPVGKANKSKRNTSLQVMAGTADTHAVNKWCHLAFVAAKDAMRKGSARAAVHKRVVIGAAVALLFMPPGQAAASPALTAVRTPDGVVLRGTSLYLASKPWQFTGVNAPEAASDYAINGGCGAEINVLSLFDSLPRNSVVRVNFDQDETIDVGPDVSPRAVNRDWRGLDQVVAAANQSTSHVHLIAYLGTQGGTCDGEVFKTDEWYKSGYLEPYAGPVGYGDSTSYAHSSYWSYLQQVISRYAGNPAILMWEPMSEPEASDCLPGYRGGACYGNDTCPADATTTLVNWFDQVGDEVHSLDPGALVGTGELTSEQCGWSGGGESRIDEAAGVDVASYHDYGSDSAAMPGGLALAIADAKQAGKPLVVGEVGVPAGEACPTGAPQPGTEMSAKYRSAMAAGVAGWLPWC
jgi:mannan endo-1,4-beta-mannosidase